MNAHARIIEKSLSLAKNYLDASGIIFYQINEDKKDAVIESDINVSKEFIHKYNGLLQDYDPLNVEYFLKSRKENNLLSAYSMEAESGNGVYQNFVNSCGINDILEMIFWKNNHAYAGIAVTNPDHHKKTDIESIQILQQVLEHSVFEVSSIKEKIIENYLKEYKLTTREIEVCSLISQGCNNSEISEIMDISVGTVKININRVFDKLQVNGRLQLSILINDLIK